MNLKEFYESLGVNYDDILSRLRKEERIDKYLRKFIADTSYEKLCVSIQEQNYNDAFAFAHTLKGMIQNIELGPLIEPIEALVEDLRSGGTTQLDSLFNEFNTQYLIVKEKIETLD